MAIESELFDYFKYADALLVESLKNHRMPKENVEETSCRMNLEAVAIEQENFG
ncbi:MAG: hypothetical protein KIH89_004355 [Candidatus Shapirobacteria bacterium]|nr:hypothetical protein [Candidatus Shapirobacteria bacterium]